jgi:hypothetical protein
MRLLVDECLSPTLATSARERGFHESSHVTWIGKRGAKDWELLRIVVEGNWTFVTKDAVDFRVPRDAPGTKGEFARTIAHKGLVCLNGPVGMDLALQADLFCVALDQIELIGDMTNQVLEVTAICPEPATVDVVRYTRPKSIAE